MEDRLTAPTKAINGPDDFAKAFDVPRETIHKLVRYAELLSVWQKAHNLVGQRTLNELWGRHFADSAQLLRLAPDASTWLDLGSGAGFPGLVIAILQANHAKFRVHLVESTGKKCAFLAEVARAAGAPVEIHGMRIEELARRAPGLEPDVITARALAPLPRLLELASPWFREGTKGLFLKGREAAEEIDAASKEWRFESRCHQSLTAPDASIVEVRNLSPRGGSFAP